MCGFVGPVIFLYYILITRWERRKDGPTFDSWVIQEANWLTLEDEVEKPEGSEGFDAVICMGNSFPHLLDDYGDFRWRN